MFQTFNNMIASHNLRPTSTHPPYYQHTPCLHAPYTLQNAGLFHEVQCWLYAGCALIVC